jgi:ketosteroid isomerase-like protein
MDRGAAVVRRFYEAVAKRDLEAARVCFAEHALWVLPGRSPTAGEHRGWDAIRDDFLVKLDPLSEVRGITPISTRSTTSRPDAAGIRQRNWCEAR